MSWTDFYLICFSFGFLLSLLSLLGSIDFHIPHFDLHFGGHDSQVFHPGDGQGHGHGGEVSPINFGTVSAFLTWFGGTGYLIARFSSFWFLFALGLAGMSGLVGATIMFYFLAKVLIQKDENLNPADYDMIGVLGKVSGEIRPSGIGEIMFSQAGTRRASPARSEAQTSIAKGTEVVVTRYERGIAYVRPWDELTNSTIESK
jgi:membrane protein implicated in regulation of membrane protease activity